MDFFDYTLGDRSILSTHEEPEHNSIEHNSADPSQEALELVRDNPLQVVLCYRNGPAHEVTTFTRLPLVDSLLWLIPPAQRLDAYQRGRYPSNEQYKPYRVYHVSTLTCGTPQIFIERMPELGDNLERSQAKAQGRDAMYEEFGYAY